MVVTKARAKKTSSRQGWLGHEWLRPVLLTAAIAGGLALLALLATTFAQRYPAFLQYRVTALGSTGGGDALMGLLVREWDREHRIVRLQPKPGGIIGENARRVEAGEADMAIVRADDPAARSLRTIFKLQTIGLVALVPPGSALETGTDLKGKAIALLGPAGTDDRLLQITFAALGLAAKDAIAMEPKAVGPAMRAGKVSAALAIVPLAVRSALLTEAAASITRSYRKKPGFLDIAETAAITAAHPVYAVQEANPRILGVAVDDPSETVDALSIDVLLLSRPGMPKWIAGQIASTLSALRVRLLASEPSIAQIASPDVEALTGIELHPGVRNYLNGELPSLADEAISLYWILAAVAAIVSPLLVFLLNFVRGTPADQEERLLVRAASLATRSRTAPETELGDIGLELEELTDEAVEAFREEEIEANSFICIEALIRHALVQISARRREESPTAFGRTAGLGLARGD